MLRDGQYIGTVTTKDVEMREIISMMVGREVSSDARPRTEVTSDEVVLKVEGLATKKLLHDVSFEVRKGEILGFAGLMGAGLGIKQLEGDPFTNFASTHDKGSVVTGTVTSVDARGATIQIEPEVEGYLRASEISRDRVEDARTHLSEGATVESMIINIDRKNRSIALSIKARENADTADAMQRMAESSAVSGTTNLGALLRAKLDNQDRS